MLSKFCVSNTFFQTLQFEGSVSDIVIFYLDDFVGLISPFWVILLSFRIVVFFFSKTLTISFTFTSGYLRLFFSLFVKLTLTSKWFLSSWASLGFILVDEWTVSLYLSSALDNIAVQLPRLNLTLSCIIFFMVLMKRSTTLACVRVTTWVMPWDDNNQLAEDVYDHHRISRLIVLDWNFSLWLFGKGFHIHYVNLESNLANGVV